MLCYLVIYAFPRYNDTVRSDMKEKRMLFIAALDKQRESHHEVLNIVEQRADERAKMITTAIKEQTEKLCDAFGSDPAKICQAAHVLQESGVCRAEDVTKFAKLIMENLEKHPKKTA